MIRLPSIERKLNESLAATVLELRQIPQPPSQDPNFELQTMIWGLVKDLGRMVEGAEGAESLIRHNNAVVETFRARIKRTEPCLIPYDREKQSEEYDSFIEDWQKRTGVDDSANPNI